MTLFQSSESPDVVPASVVDVSSFTRRQKYLLFVPNLLEIAFALIVYWSLTSLARLAFAGAVWASLALTDHSEFALHLSSIPIIAALAAALFLLLFFPPLVAFLAYRAFAHSSTWPLAAATLLILGALECFSPIDGQHIELGRAIAVVTGIAGAYVIQSAMALLVFSDAGGWILWRGLPTAPMVAALHRYGALSRARIISSTLRLCLWLSLPTAFVVLVCAAQFVFMKIKDDNGFLFLMAFLSWLAVIFIARPYFTNQLWRALRRFRSENAETAAAVYELDKRPRILLLRSFYDDTIEVPYARSLSQAVFGLKLHRVRLEEAIVDVAYRYGPVGALQDPNSQLKPLGAARDLATNQDWQSHIRSALHDASVVIIVLGSTPRP